MAVKCISVEVWQKASETLMHLFCVILMKQIGSETSLEYDYSSRVSMENTKYGLVGKLPRYLIDGM